MVRVRVLRGVIASGKALVAGTEDDISESDARILIASRKVELLPDPPQPPAAQPEPAREEHDFVEAPKRETATRGRRRKATLQ